MAGRRSSTAAKVDAAFVRVVKLVRKKSLPQWRTVDDASADMDKQANTDEIQTYRQVLTFNECKQLYLDLQLINEHLGEVPWDLAKRVK